MNAFEQLRTFTTHIIIATLFVVVGRLITAVKNCLEWKTSIYNRESGWERTHTHTYMRQETTLFVRIHWCKPVWYKTACTSYVYVMFNYTTVELLHRSLNKTGLRPKIELFYNNTYKSRQRSISFNFASLVKINSYTYDAIIQTNRLTQRQSKMPLVWKC